MSSRFDATYLAFASPVVDFDFGETITLTDGTQTITPTASITTEMVERRRDDTGLVIVYTRKATLKPASIVSLSDSQTTIGMTALIDGIEYDVEHIGKSGSSITLKLARYAIRERTGPDYRRR